MPVLNIDGVGRVRVDDSFNELSPEDQQRTVNEIASSYHQGRARMAGAPIPEPINPLSTPLERTAAKVGASAVVAGQALPLGLGDEAQALAMSAVTGRPYSETIEEARRPREIAPYPGATEIGAGIAGGIGLAAPARSALQAAGTAGAEGAVSGFGFSEGGPQERALGAGVGAAGGAVLGGLAQKLSGNLASYLARRRQSLSARQAGALDAILEELRQGDITARQAARRVERLGPEGVLADAPELRRLAQGTAMETTTGARIAENALRAHRQNLAARRIDAALDDAFQPGMRPQEVAQRLAETRWQEGSPLYDEFLAGGALEMTDKMKQALELPVIRSALKQLRDNWPDAPADTSPQMLNELYQDIGEKAFRKGGKRWVRAREALKEAITEQREVYGRALQSWSTNSQLMDAFADGRKALDALPEDVGMRLASMPDDQKAMYVAGLSREVIRKMGSEDTQTGAQMARSILRGERGQVLEEALGPEVYDQFRNRLLREIRFAETVQQVIGGSPTQPRQAAAQEGLRRVGRVSRAVEGARRGGFVPALTELATAGGQAFPAARQARARALAQAMFRSQGQNLGEAWGGGTPLDALLMRDALRRAQTPVTGRASRAVTGAAGAGAGAFGGSLTGEGF